MNRISRCGRCHRAQWNDLFWKCAVCRKKFCGGCRSVIAGNYERPHICDSCGRRTDVFSIVTRANIGIEAASEVRDKALAALKKKGAK